MPSGLLPTYSYRPPKKSGEPQLRTCSSLRARLWAGNTYFRSRDPGLKSNLISVQVIEYQDPLQAVCVVTNYGLVTSELVAGPAEVEIFDVQLQCNDKIKISNLSNANSWLAQPMPAIDLVELALASPQHAHSMIC